LVPSPPFLCPHWYARINQLPFSAQGPPFGSRPSYPPAFSLPQPSFFVLPPPYRRFNPRWSRGFFIYLYAPRPGCTVSFPLLSISRPPEGSNTRLPEVVHHLTSCFHIFLMCCGFCRQRLYFLPRPFPPPLMVDRRDPFTHRSFPPVGTASVNFLSFLFSTSCKKYLVSHA